MKGSSFNSLDSNMIIAGIVIAIIVLGLIFVFMGRKNKESFANPPEKKKKRYNFRSIRAGSGMITGVVRLAGEPKNPDEKKIRDKICPVKNGDKGSYICEERSYMKKEPAKVACGCMYDLSDNDPDNLFNKKKN